MDEPEAMRKALQVAQRMLTYRPRSEAELRAGLARRFEPGLVQEVVGRLRDLGYLDDAAFAKAWAESRRASRPRAAVVVKRELLQKGVGREAAEEAVSSLDDAEAAYRAALPVARRLRSADPQTSRRRLWAALRRRGFRADVIQQALRRLREEGWVP
ncbi:MAG: RecX family transcriptional regulator [Chloroflexi bacterium]|nr:RecX family transcriptional regulator [Chloroflexota bacterium]